MRLKAAKGFRKNGCNVEMVATAARRLEIDNRSGAHVGQAARLSIPDEVQAQTLLTSDRHLGEYRPVQEWLFFDHPSGQRRIHDVMVWKGENLKLAEPPQSSGSEKQHIERRNQREGKERRGENRG